MSVNEIGDDIARVAGREVQTRSDGHKKEDRLGQFEPVIPECHRQHRIPARAAA